MRKLLILCLALMFVLLPVTVNAASNGSISFGDLIAAWTSGPCGENVTWSIDKTGTLTVAGTGAMDNYKSAPHVPWHSKRDTIKAVKIESGVTAIGDYAFTGCAALTDVYFDGTQVQWSAVVIGSNNESLLGATLHVTGTQLGDVDGNGQLSTDDAVYLLLSVMFGTEDYPVSAGTNLDFNSSGKVDTEDAVYLLLHVMFGATDYPL